MFYLARVYERERKWPLFYLSRVREGGSAYVLPFEGEGERGSGLCSTF